MHCKMKEKTLMNGYVAPTLHLVVVDDDAAVVRLATKVIEGSLGDKFRTVAFTDASEARQWIENHPCDVLLTDLDSPAIDGQEMLRHAKAHHPWSQVIVLAENEASVPQAMATGSHDYLLKPLDHIEMVELLTQAHDRFARWQQAEVLS